LAQQAFRGFDHKMISLETAMTLAQEFRDLVVDQGTENLEFRRAGYHLSLNPAGEFDDELGFILWRVKDGVLEPIITGRTAGNRLVVDNPAFDGDPAEVEAIIRSMITGESPVVIRRDEDDWEAV
jgi:hypothetical protein